MSNYTVQDLQDNLNYLDETKQQIKQAIINKGQTILDNDTFRSYAQKIEAIQTGSGAKIFETVEEMNNDTEAKEGDLAIIYREDIQNWDGASAITSFTFPKTVVLPSAMTGSCYGRGNSPSMWLDLNGSVSTTSANFTIYGDSSYRIRYTSTDGLTYTRTDTYDTTIIISEEELAVDMFEWSEVCGYFMTIGGMSFGGLYEYKYIEKPEYISFPLLKDIPTINENYDALTINHNSENQFSVSKIKTLIERIQTENTSLVSGSSTLYINASGELISVWGVREYEGGNYAITFVNSFDYNTRQMMTELSNYGQGFSTSGALKGVYAYKLDLENMNYTSYPVDYQLYDYKPSSTAFYHLITKGLNVASVAYRYTSTTNEFYTQYFQGYKDTSTIKTVNITIKPSYYYWASEYIVAPTQLTLGNANQLLPGKIAYGKNGVVEGDTSVYDNIGLIKPMLNVTGIDINTKDLLLDPMKKMVSPKTNGTVLVDGTESYLYCRRLLPEVDMSDFGNCTVMSSNRILGSKQDSTNNTLTFKSYNLDTGELTIHNTFSTTKIADITTRSVQITDELGYVVSADKSTSKLYIYKLEGDTVEEVINTTLTLAGIYTDGVTLDLLGGANGYLYFGVLRPNNKLYIYKVVDKTLVEVKNVTLHTGFDYHNDIYCTRAGNYLYFGYFRGWSFNTNSNNQIICINTTDDSSSVITHANTSVRLDSVKTAYDNTNMYLLSSNTCVTITPTTMTVSDPLPHTPNVYGNYNYFYYDKTANILKIVGGPYKGTTFDINTGKLEESDLYYPIGDTKESLTVLDWTKLHNPDNTVFYMRQSNYIAKGFICYWLDNKQFVEDVNDSSPYFRLNDSVMFKLGHSNPRIITANYEGTISPEEYEEAVNTAKDIQN